MVGIEVETIDQTVAGYSSEDRGGEGGDVWIDGRARVMPAALLVMSQIECLQRCRGDRLEAAGAPCRGIGRARPFGGSGTPL